MATYAGTVEGERMKITQTTTVMFDPVKEWEAVRDFEAKNKDWTKEESTVCVAFTKMEHWNIAGVWHSGKWHIPAKGEE